MSSAASAQVIADILQSPAGYFVRVMVGPFPGWAEAAAEIDDVLATAKSMGLEAASTPTRAN